MFSKIIILFIAVGAAAAQVVSGTGDPIIVPNTHDYVGPYAEWLPFETTDSRWIISNVGANIDNKPDTWATVATPEPGAIVYTNRNLTAWAINPAELGLYVIKMPFEDLLWTLISRGPGGGEIQLQKANGSPEQRWNFTVANPPAH